MALVVKDRVKETTTTTGTGTLTLAGAVDNFQTFTSALADQDTTYYAIIDGENNEFEVGIGTFTSSGTTLSRDTILESSNAGSAVNLQAGEKEVFITYPAERSLFKDANDEFAATNVNYDNTTSGLTSSNVKNAIDELNDKKVDVSALSSTLVYYPTDTASGISTYTSLVTSTTDANYDTTAVDIATGVVTENGFIAGVISAQGTIVGTPGLINIHTVGNIRKTAGNANENAGFYFEVYKYAADTTETLLTTSSTTENVNSASYVEFVADALLPVTATFAETDRFLIKYYADNVAGSPEYDFQFGGGSPVRTSVPVPVDVVPHSNDATDILTDTSAFGGVLSGSDSTVQAALDTIDDAFATVATSGDYNDLSNTPSLATVATSGDYTDLSNTPTIPVAGTDFVAKTGGEFTGPITTEVFKRYGSSTSPVTFTVTVASKTASHPYTGVGSASAFFLDGEESPALHLEGVDTSYPYYYRFDQADASNSGHPIYFYLDAAKTTQYTTGVTTAGTPGSAGAYTQIAVDVDTPTVLYYQCANHANMGNYVTTSFDSENIDAGVSQGKITAIAMTFNH